MNRYLEKIAEINKEAMNTQALADIARQVGLRRDGDWRGLARQFADNKGQLLPAQQRAAVRQKLTGISNNAIQQVQSAQRRLRQSDEVNALVSRTTGKLHNAGVGNKHGVVDSEGSAYLFGPRQDSDGAMRQARSLENVSSLLKGTGGNKAESPYSFVHTHPITDAFKRISKAGDGVSSALKEESASRANIPSSSISGHHISSLLRSSSTRDAKRAVHSYDKKRPIVTRSFIDDMESGDNQRMGLAMGRYERDAQEAASSVNNEKLRSYLTNAQPGDHQILPQVARRNQIIGHDGTLGVSKHRTIASTRPDELMTTRTPFKYQHAYFDINQGGHKATRRLIAAGIDPEKYGLNTAFLK